MKFFVDTADVEAIAELNDLGMVDGVTTNPSLIAKVFTTLAREQTPLHVISQGASQINLTLVTDPDHGLDAMRALHQAFFGLD